MIFPEARQCADLVADKALEQNVFVGDVFDAIATAVGTGAYTAQIAIATYEGEEITPVVTELRQKGYYVTNDGTNLDIYWDGRVDADPQNY